MILSLMELSVILALLRFPTVRLATPKEIINVTNANRATWFRMAYVFIARVVKATVLKTNPCV